MSLIVTGSIGIDTIQAPTGQADGVIGGSCVYFAAAASFFTPVRLVAAAGDDLPESFIEVFHHFGVDLAGLERRPGSKTFRWTGKYHDNMNVRDTLDVQLGVLAEKLPPVPPPYRDSRYVFLANTHPAGQLELLEQFPQRRLAVADTMDLWIDHEKAALLQLLKKIDGLVLNDSEAFQLTGQTNIVRAAEAVLALGPTFVVIKKGEHGAFLLHREGVAALPAFAARDVVDPTGAGDSFAGGMMGYLAATQAVDENRTLSLPAVRKAMAFGTVVASFTIEAFSLDRLRQISRSDIDTRFAAYCAMLRV
jgi:sugar/nucleoside kinase (ribokinase family)